jgi:serine/threonine-protein kinase
LVIVLLVVLGLLVMICSGVVAFRLRKSNDNGAMPASWAAISALRSEDGRDGPLGAPYRQMERVVYPGGVTR